ncbi:MAG: hypothetical protein EBS20_07625, partial [Actinobacteria bacterium]|nr:hypothetical protein [Actinomycetota bacterium]
MSNDAQAPSTDLTAAEVAWELDTLLSGADATSPGELLERAEAIAAELQDVRGRVATLNANE